MYKKVIGARGYIPTLQSPKSGWSRDGLINVIRKKCTDMLLDLGNGNEPAESLAGALGVAGLTLKLIVNQPVGIDFRTFHLLTDYLLECSDMDKVPNFYWELLTLYIDLKSHVSLEIHTKELMKEEIQKEVVWNILSEHAFDQDFLLTHTWRI
ncbi:hypothetical protein F511_12458 [Dorcoceras hygrometricum]|uniref:Uncharacterized protein n=1 Tax=Dorcoceras hygrometricum TaxID=472368 RepID=A0A2Z7BKL2_9LAMI|nr:hypothetical protein F511_12458 [Dorcoceras hygrometricum]